MVVTYPELLQFCLVIIALINLVVTINNGKK